MDDTSENRKEAEKRSRTIELDILSDNFDPTLNKYRSKSYITLVDPIKLKQSLSLDDIWQQFCEVKKPTVAPGSWKNGYLIMTRHLARCPVPKTLENADAIYDWAVANLTPDTARRLIMFLTSCCDWAKRHKLIDSNPFEGMDSIKVVKHMDLGLPI